MKNSMRMAFAAFLVASAVAGCTGSNLAGAVGALASAAGGTSGAISTGGAACAANPSAAPAAAPTTATAAQGNYVGQTIPNGWDTAYEDQASLDAGFTKLKSSNPTAWETAKCIYQPALATWSKNTGNAI